MEGGEGAWGLAGRRGMDVMAARFWGGGWARVVGMPGGWGTAEETVGFLPPCCSAISATLHSCRAGWHVSRLTTLLSAQEGIPSPEIQSPLSLSKPKSLSSQDKDFQL